MIYNYIKALHIIFIITWFAGLFYIPRLFIYHIEAQTKEASAAQILITQFRLMERRLWYIITWPSAILAIIFAIWMLLLMPSWLTQSWMQLKLFFVFINPLSPQNPSNVFALSTGQRKLQQFFYADLE